MMPLLVRERTGRPVVAEDDLRYVVGRRELRLHWQPVLEPRSGRVSMAEALIRWQHPEHGLLGGEHFLDEAEQAGALPAIEAWALRTACQDAAWLSQRTADPSLRLAVNLSAPGFLCASLPAAIVRALERGPLAPTRLTLELTEAVFADPLVACAALERVRKLGVGVALEDAGCQLPSLRYLQDAPIDTIKLDPSLVDAIATDPHAKGILHAAITLAHQLDLEVVAKGLQTEDQLALLRTLGCDQAQGHLFSPPLPIEEFAYWLRLRTDETFAHQEAHAAGITLPPADTPPVGKPTPQRAPQHPPPRTRPRTQRRPRARTRQRTPHTRPTLASLANTAWWWSMHLAGLALALYLTLPIHLANPSHCPPQGEGYVACQLQKAYAPAITIFLAVLLATNILTRRLPRTLRWLHELAQGQWQLKRLEPGSHHLGADFLTRRPRNT